MMATPGIDVVKELKEATLDSVYADTHRASFTCNAHGTELLVTVNPKVIVASVFSNMLNTADVTVSMHNTKYSILDVTSKDFAVTARVTVDPSPTEIASASPLSISTRSNHLTRTLSTSNPSSQTAKARSSTGCAR